MDKLKKEERRRYARIDRSVCAWLSFQRDMAVYATLAVDVSADGAQFSTLKPVRPGDLVLVTMQVKPGGLQCKGKVCWSSLIPNGQHCFGVHFVDLTDEEREHLLNFVGVMPQMCEMSSV